MEEQYLREKRELVERYRRENRSAVKGQTVFAGSSLMEMFPVEEWTKQLGENAPVVYNRGVGGYKTEDLWKVLDVCVLDLRPAKVFINIGTNDLGDPERTLQGIMESYERIITRIEQELPGVKIYLMAYYPVNFEAAIEEVKPVLKIRSNEKVALANERVKEMAACHGQRYIDVNAPLKDEGGNLKAEYTIEGLHIKPEGYRAIFEEVMRYVKE
ncbi:MAG: lysophospholipase [Provencibacterium sp.]|nr:lysophospholipase [Provencibacterium sp.]